MTKMQIAICDDEREIRELLRDKVQKAYPEAEIYAYETGENFLAAGRHPDILFLDIQMQGRDGMETAREFRKNNKGAILIFVTAMEEYVFQAFDVGAFHYLVKPFTDEKFYEVLTNAVNRMEEKGSGEKSQRYMMIHSGGSHIRILLDDIVYAEVFNRKVMLHMQDGDVEYYGKLSELEKTLGEDFFRPHRAYLIHFKYVVKYDASSITMTKGTVLMAKANFTEFVRKYLKYNQRKGKEIQ